MHPHLASRHLFFTASFTALAALALVPASTIAQTTAPSAPGSPKSSTVDPVVSSSVFVPPVLYRSVFVDTPTGIEMEETDWRQANAAVGRFKRGHVDILRWEEGQHATQNIAPYQSRTLEKP